MAVYQTAVQYHFFHALGLLLMASAASSHPGRPGSCSWALPSSPAASI
jgi:uncharacterized membrane protein YgdD (TMEM256/DUF423 family)